MVVNKEITQDQWNVYWSRSMTELSPEERSGDWLKILQERDQQKKLLSEHEREQERIKIIEEHRNNLREHAKTIAFGAEIYCTDFGNAKRFMLYAEQFNVKYCKQNDQWYLWNEGYGMWRQDRVGQIQELAKLVVNNIPNEIEHKNMDHQDKLRKWAFASQTPARLNAMLQLVSTDCDVAITADDLDNDIYLFNMNNCTYDLENHTVLKHDSCNMITKTCGYDYNPDAKCPEWIKFLNRIFEGNKERDLMIRYLQKAIGYSLTGSTAEQSIFMLHGSGANGKSTFIEGLRLLMGDYGTTIDSKSLTTDATGVRNDIAALTGVRLLSASENKKGSTLDEELIKRISGGDKIKCRFLFHEEFEFAPVLKLWWAFNHAPRLRDMTHSMWRRVKLIPFHERITDAEKIPIEQIIKTFKSELPGIFNWAIEGLKLYQQEGLKDICSITETVDEFKVEQDILNPWITDRLEFGDDSISITSTALYSSYISWCELNNERRPLSITKFSSELKEREWKKEHRRDGNHYLGVKTKSYGISYNS